MAGSLRVAALLLLCLLQGRMCLWAWDEPELMRSRRADMVRIQIQNRGVDDPGVLEAMRSVPRHLFVPPSLQNQAYYDNPLPIGEGQTISQPYIVALMTELLRPAPGQRVLEIGTGSGYQAAVLSALVAEVYTIEIKEPLFREASARLRELGYRNVHTRHGDGYYGWEEAGPFDGILITAAVDHVPPPLLRQLVDGGRMVLPLGHPFSYQNLVLVTRSGDDYTLQQVTGVLFVPMTGKALEDQR
jgi:protein-L-isoaspartate(D-aspartate) O-methyltransferase